ncbi:MAG: SRPBCC family protein [Halodesulfurarchaeum sp.]
MTVSIERDFVVDGSPESVWSFLQDPENRARAISLVDRFEVEGETTIWHLDVPIPGSRQTLSVRTRPIDRKPPESVSFEGQSSVFDVVGEHRIHSADGKTTVHNRFEVAGKVPGVERIFKRRFDGEIANLERELTAFLESR